MNLLESQVLQTDQPREILCVQRPTWLTGVSYWSVTASARLWAHQPDTFTAWLTVGPDPTRATWSSRGETRVATPGCVQLMGPGETHRTLSVSCSTDYFVCRWEPSTLEHAAEELGLCRGNLGFKTAQLEPCAVSSALSRLHAAVNGGASLLELEHHHSESTALLLEHGAEQTLVRPRWGRHHPGVRRALELLHASFASNLSLEELARESRLSKFHLARCFRAAIGMAPHQYQKLLRLEAGRRLLEVGESVRMAAEAAGFVDASHFTRAFRAWVGVSPSKWGSAHGQRQRERHDAAELEAVREQRLRTRRAAAASASLLT
jgi:AraC-like DNA-binding protein